MPLDPTIEAMVGQVLSPLSGDVGEDLAQSGSTEFIQIRNQFTDSSKNFSQLFEVGREILSNTSKDFWALWALVGGLLWSQQFPKDQGFAGSCRIVREFCERYWNNGYPEKMGLRNTLLTGMVKWWTTFVARGSDDAQADLLSMGLEDLQQLEAILKSSASEDPQAALKELPVLNNLGHLISTLQTVVKKRVPAPVEAAESSETVESEAPASTESSPSETETTESEAAPPVVTKTPVVVSSLETAFEKAKRTLNEGNIEGALSSFQQVLEAHGDFASQFRGRVMLGELYLDAKLPTHAKRVLQHLHEELDAIRLPQWEPKLCTRLWSALIVAQQTVEKDEKPDKKLLADLFARVCRLDPGLAAKLEPQRD
ncbi:hypothetical protein Pan216_23830 [Planctomycetes bacterium Pan216]|uniref:ImpA N-terminal domain-containing protein n=1 Tax=Kolteria novifilia TaxID=2527975 RepID=A0A518B3K7_9BACT|nr:hypothetical protein Pan216_23830 [Planctomycetes bacterium Pan216]